MYPCIGNTGLWGQGYKAVSSTDCNQVSRENEAAVWSKSLGGTYSGKFAYGLYSVLSTCNSWSDISHHWWVARRSSAEHLIADCNESAALHSYGLDSHCR